MHLTIPTPRATIKFIDEDLVPDEQVFDKLYRFYNN